MVEERAAKVESQEKADLKSQIQGAHKLMESPLPASYNK